MGDADDVAISSTRIDLMTLNNLALLLATSGRGDAAEPLYEEALRTFTARLDPGHPKIRGCAANYARCSGTVAITPRPAPSSRGIGS